MAAAAAVKVKSEPLQYTETNKYVPFDQLHYPGTVMVDVMMDGVRKMEVHHFGNIGQHTGKTLNPKIKSGKK